jgi:thymidylate kinase
MQRLQRGRFDHAILLCYDKPKLRGIVMPGIGKLIVLEGVDDEALNRLADHLCRWLRARGLAVEHTAEPTYGPAGTHILQARAGRMQFDATSMALLYLADRIDHMQRVGGIQSQLETGQHVICIHQELATAARLLDEVDWNWLHRIGSPIRAPDLTLFVDLPARETVQTRLRESYLAAIQSLQESSQGTLIVVEADTPHAMHLACHTQISRLLGLEPSSTTGEGAR